MSGKKLVRLPILPVRNSYVNALRLKENDYGLQKPDVTVFLNTITPNPSSKYKLGSTVTIECDSICEPNPGGIGCVVFIAFNEKREIMEQSYKCIGRGKSITNNVAEYHSVIFALEWALGRDENVKILTSSKVVVNQIQRSWECHQAHLQPLIEEANELLKSSNSTLEWRAQKENKMAETLCIKAYEEAERKFKGGKDEQ